MSTTRRNFLKACGLTVGCVTAGGASQMVLASPETLADVPPPDEYTVQKREMYSKLYGGGSTPEEVINEAIGNSIGAPIVDREYPTNEKGFAIPEIWARQGLAILQENMVAGNLIHRDFCDQLALYGDVVNCYRPNNFRMTRLSDDDHVIRMTNGSF